MPQSPFNHQDNFTTNLTSNIAIGATSGSLNLLPTVAAPFWIVYDALNENGKYEVVYVTSKGVSSVNHAATTYAHTTSETVRLVAPSRELDLMLSAPQGMMRNGKIVPTVSSNGITLSLKTLNGNDPSLTDPIIARIGDVNRVVVAPLSVSIAQGTTNPMNLGGLELTGKETDLFAYLGYNVTDGVVIGFARFGSATQYGDFNATATNEKYAKISTITNAASTDPYECIGRFAATVTFSTPNYNWSVPTYSQLNLIQKPTTETRWLDYTPIISVSGGTAPTYTATFINKYKILSDTIDIRLQWTNSSGGTAGAGAAALVSTLPFSVLSTYLAANRSPLGGAVWVYEAAGTGAVSQPTNGSAANNAIFSFNLTSATGADQSSGDRAMVGSMRYQI